MSLVCSTDPDDVRSLDPTATQSGASLRRLLQSGPPLHDGPGFTLQFCLFALVLLTAPSAFALTNNLALTPPMGWNDWNKFGCSISETIVRATADAVATNGMKAAGYQYINVDDCWQLSRDANGVIVPDPSKFPSGMKALADYVHSKGLKFGLYSDHGTNTCQHKPGSYGYEYLDAMTYASWGVDYLKEDNCNVPANASAQIDYGRMSQGLMLSGQPIALCLCGGNGNGAKGYVSWSPVLGNQWRTTGDIGDNYPSMISKLDPNSTTAYAAGPGRWNDPDMLEIGNGGMTTAQDQTHFTMWCISAAPLICGTDLRTPSAATLNILTNPEAIGVNQDPTGEQGIKVINLVNAVGTNEVWCKTLGYDFSTKAVALFNRQSPATNITCYWTNLGLRPGPATVRDLWAHTDLGTFTDSFTANVASNAAMLLKVVGTPPTLPAVGTTYLSDLQPAYAYTGFGTILKDKSVNGNTLTLNGVTYSKGIGVNSRAGSEYFLGGICSRFQATVGVDDEVGTKGSVRFEVFADGAKIYDSGVMAGGATAQALNLDVTGVSRLVLGLGDADDGNSFDHGDWANARVTVTNTTPQAPYAPAGLLANPGNTIALAWNGTPAALGYNVKRSSQSGGPYTSIGTTAVTIFTDTTVALGTNYYYVVTATNRFGESALSSPVAVVPCALPSVPSNLVVSVSALQPTLSWSPVAGASSYTINRFAGTTAPTIIANGVTGTNFTDTSVVPGTTNYYMVAAVNACNQGAYSPFVAAIVPGVGPATWNGGSTVDSFWTDTNNWNGATPVPGSDLAFGGSARLNNTNDTAAGSSYSSLTFASGAGRFTLNGNPITLAGSVLDSSVNPQALNLGLNFSNNITFTGAGGPLLIGGGLTNTFGAPGSTTLTLSGAGFLTNLLNSAANPGGTNAVLLSDSTANWTLVDNASSAPMTVPWVFEINNGTFNFGASTSAPNLTTTTPNNVPSDNQVGAVSGATATFNMVNGTLTTSARFNTATASSCTGIVNQVGGTWNIGSQFQGANGANAGEISIVNVSGGTMNISGGGGPFYVASRGNGSLNVSGSGVVTCGKLDISRNAAGNTVSSSGTVNLNGGTLMVTSVTNISANQQTGGSPTAAFNFNGGTLVAKSGAAAGFFQGSTVTPVTPITTLVQGGGAMIDDGGNSITIAEALQHDPSLGSSLDGGLTKLDIGTLTLSAGSTYNGNTTVAAGTLALSGVGSVANSTTITVAAGATLDASARSDNTLSLGSGQTLTGSGIVKGNVLIGSGATLAPGGLLSTLTLNNNLTLNTGSRTLVEVSKNPNTNDLAIVASILTYGGSLVITNVSSGSFAAGDSFRLFSAAAYNGTFASLVPVIPAVNLAWNTNTLTTGVLSIISSPTPRPKITALKMSAGTLTFSATNGVPGWPCYILASTNLVLPLTQWTTIGTNIFDANGNLSFTNSPNPNLPRTFYLLRLQ